MRNLRRLVKWSIRVVKVVLLYRLYILDILHTGVFYTFMGIT
jgi:hypothetical protein